MTPVEQFLAERQRILAAPAVHPGQRVLARRGDAWEEATFKWGGRPAKDSPAMAAIFETCLVAFDDGAVMETEVRPLQD